MRCGLQGECHRRPLPGDARCPPLSRLPPDPQRTAGQAGYVAQGAARHLVSEQHVPVLGPQALVRADVR